MARDPQKHLTETLAPYEKPKLRLVDANGKITTSLDIANLLDGTITGAKMIGFQKNGVKYLIDEEGIKKREVELRSEGKNARQIDYIIAQEFPLRTIPANYPEPYEVRDNGLIITQGNFDPSKSEDKFFVEYEDSDLVGRSSIEVNLATGKDSEKVTLYPVQGNPGLFRSKELILISKKEFDHIKTDQTIVAGLSDIVQVSYQSPEGKIDTALAQVPIKKELPIRVIVLRDRDGKPVTTPEEVEKRLGFAQQSLAQAGIKVSKIETVYFDVPLGVDLKNGLNVKEQLKIAESTVHLAPEPGLRVIFGGNIAQKIDGNALKGGALTQRSAQKYPYAQNTVFLMTDPLPQNVTTDSVSGHELAHPIIDALNDEDYAKYQLDITGHSPDSKNLMHHASMLETEGDGLFRHQQHLADDKTLLRSSVLVDPPPPRSIRNEPREVQAAHREGLHFVPRP
jgi:hypothetical protein